MPNRYEREIEEILRNLEQTEPKQGLGQKFSGRLRRRSGPQRSVRQQPFFSFNFSAGEWLLIIAVLTALVAGGYSYLQGVADILTGILATVSIGCLILVALSQLITRPQGAQSVRYGNVTITPLRRNPFSQFKTQWNLFMLKIRYRRKNGR
jgi:hypothetical protein